MAKPVVAVVVRPHVAKSTLFNKLIGQRLSIVDDTPGVTRDRSHNYTLWVVHAGCRVTGNTARLNGPAANLWLLIPAVLSPKPMI